MAFSPDGKLVATVKTKADEPGAGYHRFVLPEGPHEIEIKLENGHKIKLKRVDKIWYIDNFE